MKIGIMGLGVVGSALAYGFTRIGHEVIGYDVKGAGELLLLRHTQLVFICVPTPQRDDGSCDISVVERAIGQLFAMDYKGPIVIKSTVVPGTTDALNKRWAHPHPAGIHFCPEFLREKATYSDFIENHELLIIGTDDVHAALLIREAHGELPRHTRVMSALEAELAKYFCNALNATRIVFASQFFEVCESLGADYARIKSAVTLRTSIGNHYLDCNERFRKFGGACLPKDLAALSALVRAQDIDAPLFSFILSLNEKLSDQQENDSCR